MITFLRILGMTTAAAMAPTLAWADTSGGATSTSPGSFLLHSVTLLILVACVLASFKFYTSIKGGRVASGWMWVFCGFLVFTCSQMFLFAGQLGVLPLMLLWVDVGRVVSLLLFFVGINQLRKIMA